jgi:hypothetical protein
MAEGIHHMVEGQDLVGGDEIFLDPVQFVHALLPCLDEAL